MVRIVMIITKWIPDPDEGLTYYIPPMIGVDTWTDYTGQRPPQADPNSVILRGMVEEDTFVAIQSDPDIYLWWDEPNPKNPDGIPSASEWGLVNAFLAIQDYSPQDRRDAIGKKSDNKTREQLADSNAFWLARGRA